MAPYESDRNKKGLQIGKYCGTLVYIIAGADSFTDRYQRKVSPTLPPLGLLIKYLEDLVRTEREMFPLVYGLKLKLELISIYKYHSPAHEYTL